jgi:tubulin polyglutamylase TTLL6/13
MIIKTLLSVQPQLAHSYKACTPTHAGNRSCFELLGFDVLIDKKFKPFLLEVNHAPSFNDDTEVDKHVKTELITDTIRILNITYAAKQRIQEAQRKAVETNQVQKKPARFAQEED